MRFVRVKSLAQQDIRSLQRRRERIGGCRRALVNQTRGVLAEYGLVIPQGIAVLRRELPALLEDAENGLTPRSRALFAELREEEIALDEQMARCEREIREGNRNGEVSRRPDRIPGIGEITATAAYAALGNGNELRNGRHFPAWPGLEPRQHSSGGKARLSGVGKRGNTYLRTCCIHGARSLLRASAGKEDRLSRWTQSLVERRGHNKACVAVANKPVRIALGGRQGRGVSGRGMTYFRPAMDLRCGKRTRVR